MKPIKLVASVIACAVSATAGAASDFPSKPLKLIVPFSPGGPTDTVCRIIANKLSTVVSQAVVVDNRDGAGGAIGARAAASAPADGYTLFCASTSTLAILPALKSNLGYDPVKSFTPIAGNWSLIYVVKFSS